MKLPLSHVPYGWTRDFWLLYGALVAAGMGALASAQTLWVRREMNVEDAQWAFVALGSVAAGMLCALVLVDRLPVIAALAARPVAAARAGNLVVAVALQGWPLAGRLLGVSWHTCWAAVAQAVLVLGLGAWLGGARRDHTPTTVTYALAAGPGAVMLLGAMVPGLLPLAVHPITTAHRPLGLIVAECCIGLAAALLWVWDRPALRR